ncbi:single-stranded DNA-binding protein [Parasphingorhabdus sp.]|uniref:single-stranded DNA-binding protein n=1 Tax=Parasphingorhabdus sp. TaxID=2709688 RepID=UPI0032984AC3
MNRTGHNHCGSRRSTTRSCKDSEGERQQDTEWHRITRFNAMGKCVAEHVTKGAIIMVTGRIHYTKDQAFGEWFGKGMELLELDRRTKGPHSKVLQLYWERKPDGPDLLLFQRCLLSDQLSLVPWI